ncbi:sensor domain-containing protein, partial [Streptomyces boncukensis]
MEPITRFVSPGLEGLRRCLRLWGLALVATWYSLLALLCSSGPALLLLPRVQACLRGLTARQRALAAAWSEVRIPAPRALPPGGAPLTEQFRALFGDPRARREWLWLFLEPLAGAGLVFLPVALVLGGLWGMGMGLY